MIEVDLKCLVHIPLEELPYAGIGGWSMWYDLKQRMACFSFSSSTHKYQIFMDSTHCLGVDSFIRTGVPLSELIQGFSEVFDVDRRFLEPGFIRRFNYDDRLINFRHNRTMHQIFQMILEKHDRD